MSKAVAAEAKFPVADSEDKCLKADLSKIDSWRKTIEILKKGIGKNDKIIEAREKMQQLI